MKKDKKIDEKVLNEFFEEVQKNKEIKVEETTYQSNNEFQSSNKAKAIIYKCPQCNRIIESRTEPCHHCHYHGYIPMSEQETKRIRTILFWIILVVAIILLIVL